MINRTPRIQVFEHNSLHYGMDYKGVSFKEKHFNALVKLNELHDNKYFTVIHKGLKFKHFVGVIQVDGLTIEILPKIDNNKGDENVWQGALIEMLRVTKKLKVKKVGEANVNKQNIHLLDIYFEWFLSEVQLLVHQGLIKQYYKETSNVKALKGKLEFAGHISKNLVHKERFYTTHQVYEKDHLVHQILFQALSIVEQLSKGNYLYSKCKTVQLDFPEVKTIAANEATFTKIPKSRKTAPYETALTIARLIILNYAPSVSSGSERMLALLFDMNSLWEEYVLIRLKQAAKDVNIYGQQSIILWNGITIRPDIVIEKGSEKYIIDSKWKNIDYGKPSTHDLRQMYVYNEYWGSRKAMLLYPSNSGFFEQKDFISFEAINGKDANHCCALGKISIFKNIEGKDILDERIGANILAWFCGNDSSILAEIESPA
ncbi:McrC family protein [Flavobacterium weaverense]|uniref:5-methylcytosine-specific restriction enzyme subunit McrC n=1 Tax=Flavobacterium weaverense TaxID=271156 RepID=A0A3L9ZJH0_9FLAO|nr:McrC family protein [Flavobacterium weaverense]RMA72726.1 5-methylcytosine-specific restriction enzyme subunit McrC [Flavobacterium weaverense]